MRLVYGFWYIIAFPNSKESICLQHRRPQLDSWVGKIHWRRDRLPTPVFLGFPGGSAGKESACNAGDLGLIPGLGRSPGEGKGYPLQYSDLENSKDCVVHEVTKGRTQLSSFHFHKNMYMDFQDTLLSDNSSCRNEGACCHWWWRPVLHKHASAHMHTPHSLVRV